MIQDEYRTELLQVEEVTRYRTTDSALFGSRDAAEEHAAHLVRVAEANAMLEGGTSVADALRHAGMPVDEGSPLERITSHTQLVISHYQCRSTPGYRVVRINSNLSLRVYGDAGSWSGPYGCDEWARDVERYAARTPAPAPAS